MFQGNRRRALVMSLATVWLVVAVVIDVLVPGDNPLGSLFYVAPLIACAALSPAGTAGFAVAAVALTVAAGSWNHDWGSDAQAVRIADVALVSGIAVLVSAVRIRYEHALRRMTRIAASQRQLAEERRSGLSSLLESMLDAAAAGSAIRDASGRVVDFRVEYANAGSADYLQRPLEDLIGRPWSALWPESFDTELLPAVAGTVETGMPMELTGYPVAGLPPGDSLHSLIDLRVARFGDGVVITWRDVSARHLAAQAAAAATSQFTAAFEWSPAGMVLLDADRVIVRVNPAFCAMTGYAPDRLVGTHLDALVDPRDVEESRADFARMLAGDEVVYTRERRLLSADGEPRWVSKSVARVAAAPGVIAVEHVEDIHERKQFEGQLRFLADHDPLTGLFNRRRFHEELTHQLAVDARYGGTSAVVLVDLDNFKYINDTLGHQTGDELLQVIAHRLHGRLRDTDIICRLGGDEFAVLLPSADQADAVRVTEALIGEIRSCELDHLGQRVRSTASAGIALAEGDEVGPDDLLAKADLAMYAAKEAGRNAHVVYDPTGPHAERARAQFRWLDRIRHALEHELFVLHAQPILDLRAGRITGCELLLRMRDDGQIIQPNRFLHIAERHGLANPIDRFVIAHAIRLAAAQRRSPEFRWEINLSAASLGDPDIPRLIEAELTATGLAAANVVFEITETTAISNIAEAQAFATRITDIGCRFALDDFGAGYGSFYYLKHLPFEYLKIDGEFIRQLVTSEMDRVIVEAIVAAASKLGKQTIAEYVADARTVELLRVLGVNHAQGYHVGLPTAPDRTLPIWAPRSPETGTDERIQQPDGRQQLHG